MSLFIKIILLYNPFFCHSVHHITSEPIGYVFYDDITTSATLCSNFADYGLYISHKLTHIR